MSSKRRPRRAVTVDCLIVLGVVLLVVVAACAATRDSSSTSTQSTPEPAAESAVDGSVVQVPIETSTTTGSTTSSTSTSTTTSTIALTTTIALNIEVVAQVCESLRFDGFETRRVMVDALAGAFTAAGGDGDGRAEVVAECGDELDRLDRAVQIRDRLQTIDMTEEDGVATFVTDGFTCDAGTFEVTFTNMAATPLGLHANFAMYIDGDRENALQSSFEPIVLWSIEPGASEVVSGRFADSPQSEVYCQVEGQLFDADPSAADASIGPEPAYPALTGDDPSVWFPALSEFESAARTSGDIDLAAVTEDVRSMSYDEVALAISEGDEFPESVVLEVCERGRSQPDDDHIGFVFQELLPNGTADDRIAPGGTRLSHGLFRRGADGQWRWLSTSRYYRSVLSADCSGVNPDV